ncbi:MAG TPA: GNAT family N-acetyltransferase, partial [Beutenbergiaceae bacterium]|nr:GNAT family N-acetyltransferase [Beutenbergiaceae bacterium]
RVAGYAGIDLSPEATIMTVGVDAQFRRRGLARQMMTALLAAAAEAGCRQVHLEVRADDTGAQQLYTGLGFEKLGIRRRYYRQDGADAVTMRLRWDRPGPIGRDQA